MTKRRNNREGTLYQRPNGKWRVQLSLHGHRVSATYDTKQEAHEWLHTTRRQIENGLTHSAYQISFGQLLDEWLTAKQPTVAEQTWADYRYNTQTYIRPALGKIRLRDLTPRDIQTFYSQKVSSGLGLQTVNKLHVIMRAALNFSVKLGLIDRNPTKATQPPKASVREMMFLNEEQVHQLLSFAKQTKDRNYALYYLAIVTGMRQGELLGLCWQDVDLDKATLTVRRSLKRLPSGGLHLVKPKTKTSVRSIALGQLTVAALREHQSILELEKEIAGVLWRESGQVFPSDVGTLMDPSNLLKRFYRFLKQAGLPKVRFHDLRHTAASLMLNNGVDVLVASKRLGHAKPSITLDVYGHLIPAIQQKTAEVLDHLISV